MSRLLPLVLLSFLVLAACDSNTEPAVAEVSIGETYSMTTFRIFDAESGAFVYDFARSGATFDITFQDATRFNAHLVVPLSALLSAGETDDIEGDIDETVVGTYAQRNGDLMFTSSEDPAEFSDTFLDDEGWTISRDGRTIRYEVVDEEARIEVVLTRR